MTRLIKKDEEIIAQMTKKDRITYGSLSSLFICSLIFYLIYPFTPPISSTYDTLIKIILPILIGIFLTLTFSPPGKLHGELIIEASESIFAPVIKTAIENSLPDVLSIKLQEQIGKLMEYNITHVKESVYRNSMKILDEAQPSKIKIVMKAGEFEFEGASDKDKEALRWYDHLNDYVQKSPGRKYERVIAIYPENKAEIKENIDWVRKMTESLQKAKVTNCEIKVVIRDITLSCVLLDSKVSFFAFLIDRDFTNFMRITSRESDMLNRGINDWFDKKFENEQYSYVVFKNGKATNGKLAELETFVESRVK